MRQVINALKRTDAEKRIPVLRLELDYELATLYDAMMEDDKQKKVFGDIPKVAYFELGELTPQIVNGEALYVAPIEVSGFFKARKAETIPGY
ncbi:hypothetical protein ACT453_36715, partial [Bacillus sp. D-CC]